MKPMKHEKREAWSGCDVIRENGMPKKLTIKGWQYFAKLEAMRKSKQDNFTWTAIVAYVPWRDAYRISYAGQPEKF